MATAPALMTMEQYLRTSYSPDVDFVDGEIEERNVGESEHAELQWIIAGILYPVQREAWHHRTNRAAHAGVEIPRSHLRPCLAFH